MKKIRTEDAVGHVLCHDMTQIIKDKVKDARFRKGHIVKEEDIPVLLSMGKETLFVWEKDENMLHEDEAAEILRSLCQDEHMRNTEPKEGKIELTADCDGLFVIDRKKLLAINSLGEIIIATRHGDTPVKKGDKLAAMRVIPLVIARQKMEQARRLAADSPILSIHEFRHKKAAILTTGSEVYHGRIQDTFTPVIREKLQPYGTELQAQKILDDNPEQITAEILHQLEEGADLILCTGGMSVDPDDQTPLAIRNTGARIVTYGAPVLPGAMLLLAYTEKGVPILGLPGCVMYARQTVFDLLLPRIMADQPITAEDLYSMGEGGLCLNCTPCTYPNCGFGKTSCR